MATERLHNEKAVPPDQRTLITLADNSYVCDGELELPFEARQKARQRVIMKSGEPIGIKLPRGTVLRGGDVLVSQDGYRVRVLAADEAVSIIRSTDGQTLARAAYHLGNRHVWVEVGSGYVSYLHDHVLDAMMRQLGIEVTVDSAPFEPEAGAYEGGHHDHA